MERERAGMSYRYYHQEATPSNSPNCNACWMEAGSNYPQMEEQNASYTQRGHDPPGYTVVDSARLAVPTIAVVNEVPEAEGGSEATLKQQEEERLGAGTKRCACGGSIWCRGNHNQVSANSHLGGLCLCRACTSESLFIFPLVPSSLPGSDFHNNILKESSVKNWPLDYGVAWRRDGCTVKSGVKCDDVKNGCSQCRWTRYQDVKQLEWDFVQGTRDREGNLIQDQPPSLTSDDAVPIAKVFI